MSTYKYTYVVGGKNFTKEKTSNLLPKTNTFEITYLPEQPQVSERGNPCEVAEKNNSSSFLMYLGITLFIVGLITAWISFKRLIRVNKSPKFETKQKKEKIVVEKEIIKKEHTQDEKERIRKEKEDPNRFMPK